jgi:EAL domain-containing protein (putative c-di-GMP-specific phosphodiesterase class I)
MERASPLLITDRLLAQAISEDALRLAFQPKLSLDSDIVASVEALLRWPQESGESISPELLVSLAEQNGLIDQLSIWVVKAALAQSLRWRQQGLSLKVAVNISALNLDCRDFPDRVHDLCVQHGIASGHLMVELTESSTQHQTRLMECVTRFRLKGIAVALDDFGTGYATLAQLQRLPFSEIKIDKCFVSEVLTSEDARSIVALIITLARQLEISVTAEGIEDHETLDMLRQTRLEQ